MVAGIVKFGDILKYHIDIVIEPKKSAAEFFITLHDNPDLGSNTFVDQFERE